jgi:hypothetical protein
MKFFNTLIIIVSLVLFNTSAYAWSLFKKQTYEECILENMKGVTSDDAANEIKTACILKTSESNASKQVRCKTRQLTTSEVSLVTGRANLTDYGYMKIDLHNGNQNISLKSGKVRLTDDETKKYLDYDMFIYPIILPLTTSSDISVKVMNIPKKWSWSYYDLATEICK